MVFLGSQNHISLCLVGPTHTYSSIRFNLHFREQSTPRLYNFTLNIEPGNPVDIAFGSHFSLIFSQENYLCANHPLRLALPHEECQLDRIDSERLMWPRS